MNGLKCKNCGSSDFTIRVGLRICNHCGTKYVQSVGDNLSKGNGAGISLSNDIQQLLYKCKIDPANARKYANLILDIDPTNKEALTYL